MAEVMSMHRLSAGSGYQYLLRHTASGDVQRLAGAPLTAYYTASGYPPGRWLGGGLAGLGQDAPPAPGIEAPTRVDPPSDGEHPQSDEPPRVDPGSGGDPGSLAGGDAVTEEQMARLYGRGEDPLTGGRLGARYLVHRTVDQRIGDRVARLSGALSDPDRAAAVAAIEAEERRRGTPSAVAGFDLTFTMPKSASVLWALAPAGLQARIAAAHRDTVAEVVAVLERDALFTRTGHGGVAQIPTRGAIAACFDHWDTRAGDPNLHTHVVLANKVQGEDGRWRSVDSRALHHAAVALSELYDDLLADRLTRVAGVRWGRRARGACRTPGFEIDGIADPVLAEFSTRSRHIAARTRDLVAAFRARVGHAPDRAEVIRLRQQAALETRPEKSLRPFPELIADWRRRAETLTGRGQLVARVTGRRQRLHTADGLTEQQLSALAAATLTGLQDRRSTWNQWNVRAEAARATRGLRMASSNDRLDLLDRVARRVLDRQCVSLDPPALFEVPARWRRPDGTSAFTRHHEAAHTSPAILDAEARLLAAATDTSGPRASATVTAQVARTASEETDLRGTGLHDDQAAAVTAVVTSGRWVDVLVGPAGAGKTRTLRAVRAAWEAGHGPASVVGLAPSATAAAELTIAVGIACETTAKWQHETTRPGDASLRGQGERWRLRAGQLVIVDEASLAGTLTLDELTTQAQEVGAKVLLVGDHHQLSAISAGGAFGLLARATGATELSLLWRFRNRWEAVASRALRQGDPRALEGYAGHDRILEGPAEAMVEEAYQAWRQALNDGHRAVLIAADNDTVTALNARAQSDLIASGQVRIGGIGGATLHDETRAGVGDRVLTPHNDRRLPTTGRSWVRNGDLWTVDQVHDDGSLTVHRPSRPRDATRLPAAYVREHVELGYATTVHRAQGITADSAFALIRPGMSREAVYVALTRGRAANYAYVATDLPDPDHPSGADSADRTGRQVLEAALRRSDAEPSATETMRARYDQAASLATLVPIYETLVQAADRGRCARHLSEVGLDVATVERIVDSPACGALVAALRAGERDGHHMDTLLTNLVASIRGPATDDGSDLAAVLHDRVSRLLEDAEPLRDDGRLIAGLVPAADTLEDPELAHTLLDIERFITARVHALVANVLHRPPAWAIPLGPPPLDTASRRTWLDAIGVVAGYRDLHQIQDDPLLGAPNDRHLDNSHDRHFATVATATASRLAHNRCPPAAPSTTDNPISRSIQR